MHQNSSGSWFASVLLFIKTFFLMATRSVATVEKAVDIADKAVFTYQKRQRREIAVAQVTEEKTSVDQAALQILKSQQKLEDFVQADPRKGAQLEQIRKQLEAAITTELADL